MSIIVYNSGVSIRGVSAIQGSGLEGFHCIYTTVCQQDCKLILHIYVLHVISKQRVCQFHIKTCSEVNVNILICPVAKIANFHTVFITNLQGLL